MAPVERDSLDLPVLICPNLLEVSGAQAARREDHARDFVVCRGLLGHKGLDSRITHWQRCQHDTTCSVLNAQTCGNPVGVERGGERETSWMTCDLQAVRERERKIERESVCVCV